MAKVEKVSNPTKEKVEVVNEQPAEIIDPIADITSDLDLSPNAPGVEDTDSGLDLNSNIPDPNWNLGAKLETIDNPEFTNAQKNAMAWQDIKK